MTAWLMFATGPVHAQADVAQQVGAAVSAAVGQNSAEDPANDAADPGDSTGDGDIHVDHDAIDDAQIRRRLQQILSEIESLSSIDVSVSNSVVELSGTVDSSETSVEAVALASGIQGVVKVENNLEVSRDVSERVRSTWERVRTLGATLLVALPLLALALAVAVGFWYLAGWVSARVSLWDRLTPNAFIATLLGSTVKLVIVVLGILLALYLLDATSIITTVLGAAGIIGLAVGFAVRDTVENFIASILLSLRQPFQMNDFVQIEEHTGTVARLTGRATILISADGNQIRIPNAIVFKSIITNFTRHPQRRFNIVIPLDEAESLSRAHSVASEAMCQVPGVMDSPKPVVHVQALGEAVNRLEVYGWVDQSTHDLLKVRTVAAMTLKQALKQAGIVMPESVHTLRVLDAHSNAGDPAESDAAAAAHARSSVDTQRSHAPASSHDGAHSDARNVAPSETADAIAVPPALDTQRITDDDSAVDAQLADEQADAENLLDGNSRE